MKGGGREGWLGEVMERDGKAKEEGAKYMEEKNFGPQKKSSRVRKARERKGHKRNGDAANKIEVGRKEEWR